MPLPARIEGLDDLDHLIYDLRFRRHLSLRAIATEVDMSHQSVWARIRRFLPLLRPEDHDQLREQETLRLDELRNQVIMLAEAALTGGQIGEATKAIKEAHALTRTLIQLQGLERRPDDRPAATPDRISELLATYVQGVADGATAATERAPAVG